MVKPLTWDGNIPELKRYIIVKSATTGTNAATMAFMGDPARLPPT